MIDATDTMTDAILLHRVPGDPVRTRLADVMRTATYTSWHQDGMSDLIGYAAAQLGMTADAAAQVLGLTIKVSDLAHTPDGPGDIAFTMQVIPDGVRACYRSECTHGPGYIPPATEEWPPPREFCPRCGGEQRADNQHDEETCEMPGDKRDGGWVKFPDWEAGPPIRTRKDEDPLF